MRFVILSIALFAAAQSQAAYPQKISCMAGFKEGGSGYKASVKVDIAKNTFELGKKSTAIVSLAEQPLSGVEKVVACNDQPQDQRTKCVEDAIGNADNATAMLKLIPYMLEDVHRNYKEYQFKLKTKMNYSKIAAGRLIANFEHEETGTQGLYEYYDSRGRLLGRLLFAFVILDCY